MPGQITVTTLGELGRDRAQKHRESSQGVVPRFVRGDQDASCASDANPDAWHDSDPRVLRRAAAVCRECPLIGQCRTYGLEHHREGLMGLWGGIAHHLVPTVPLMDLIGPEVGAFAPPPPLDPIAQEVEHLLEQGETYESIPGRFGLKRASLVRRLRRAGRPDLAYRFSRRVVAV